LGGYNIYIYSIYIYTYIYIYICIHVTCIYICFFIYGMFFVLLSSPVVYHPRSIFVEKTPENPCDVLVRPEVEASRNSAAGRYNVGSPGCHKPTIPGRLASWDHGLWSMKSCFAATEPNGPLKNI
jgi:hypothetical protein